MSFVIFRRGDVLANPGNRAVLSIACSAIGMVAFVRGSIYYEAYQAEKKRGTEGFILPAMLVGLFDAPLIFAFVLFLESALLDESWIRNNYPSGISSAYSLASAFFIVALELIHYRITRFDERVVRKFQRFGEPKLRRVRTTALVYAMFSLLGGSLAIFLLW